MSEEICCPHCQEKLVLPDGTGQESVPCPACKAMVPIPTAGRDGTRGGSGKQFAFGSSNIPITVFIGAWLLGTTLGIWLGWSFWLYFLLSCALAFGILLIWSRLCERSDPIRNVTRDVSKLFGTLGSKLDSKTGTRVWTIFFGVAVLGIVAFAIIDDKRDKQDREALSELLSGVEFYDKGDYDSAIACFDEAFQSGLDAPLSSAAYLYRGDAYLAMSEFDKAISDYTQLIRLEATEGTSWNKEQTMAQAYYQRGVAYEKKGEKERASADCVRAVELDPEFKDKWLARLYYQRGVIHENMGEKERASADYVRAKKLDPTVGE